MLALRIIIALLALLVVTLLFRKASGSLKFTKLNMISAIYYYMLIFNLIGASLIYIGLHDHYLIQKIRSQETIDFTYYVLLYTTTVFPITLIGMKKLSTIVVRPRSIDDFVEAGIYYNANMTQIQGFTLALILITTISTAYVFANLGYIPIMSIFRGGNLNALRQSGNRGFIGNQYIKNLLMSTLTPFVSYLTYIYYRFTGLKSWRNMFIYMAILSIIVLTYDFSKSPVITYLLGIYLLEVTMGKVKNNKRFNRLAITAILIILFFYVVMLDAGSSLFSIYTGPIGRIIFTQIATLFLHVEAFPAKYPFLNGASFNSWMSLIFPAAQGLRSGRVVMGIYNAAGIESNTAGVMNTVFVGEAYANFGIVGVLIAPVIFGVVIGTFAYILPGLRKSPISILLYVQLTLQFITMVEGGFVDIFYSASTLFLVFIAIIARVVIGPQEEYAVSTLYIEKYW